MQVVQTADDPPNRGSSILATIGWNENSSYKVYAILDEVFLAGEIEETSKQVVLTRLEHLDKLE